MKQFKNLIIISSVIITQQIFAQSIETKLLKQGTRIEMIEFNAENVQNKTKVLIVESVTGNTSKVRSVTTENGTITEDNLQTYRYDNNGATWIIGATDTKTKKPAEVRYPINMQIGQKLDNDVNFEQSGKSPEGQSIQLSIKITDRKVIGREKITVKAGTWDCTKLSYKFSLGIKLGFIKIPFNIDAVEWYNTEVGVVKTEYTMKGKYAGHSEISSIK
ncbi:TapB family protein [Chryseobacterium taichungense]|uniref:TapB family protein n=1 Tax=Chryseobacterium taichungense TaxID=295069 RepID=UPI0028AE7822|nr:hypothetical protein [Chryseobacterium taichungense]